MLMQSLSIVYLIIKGAFFAALLKAFISNESLQSKPLLMALMYAGGVGALSYFYFNPMWYTSTRYMQIWLGLSFVFSYIYFWLLGKFEDVWVIYWTVLLAGLGLILF